MYFNELQRSCNSKDFPFSTDSRASWQSLRNFAAPDITDTDLLHAVICPQREEKPLTDASCALLLKSNYKPLKIGPKLRS